MIININAQEIGKSLALHLRSSDRLPEGKTIQVLEINPDDLEKLFVVRIIDVD